MKDIHYGRCAVIPNWMSMEETRMLRSQALDLYSLGYFVPSGLRQTPSENDYGDEDRLICEEWPPHLITPEIIKAMDDLDSFRVNLACKLGRPSMAREDLDHESYLSISFPGASLACHLDERHEELRPSNRLILSTLWSILLPYPKVKHVGGNFTPEDPSRGCSISTTSPGIRILTVEGLTVFILAERLFAPNRGGASAVLPPQGICKWDGFSTTNRHTPFTCIHKIFQQKEESNHFCITMAPLMRRC